MRKSKKEYIEMKEIAGVREALEHYDLGLITAHETLNKILFSIIPYFEEIGGENEYSPI